ncbi:hypothetical protein Esti_005257 [Eimeria stiedai]
MDNQPSVVYASTWMQARAEAALRAKFRDKSKCEESAEDLTPASMGGFYEAATSFQKTESWGTRVVQDYEHHGLEVLKEKLTANAGFNPAVAPFSQTSVQNLAYMMYPQSHEVGCAMTTNCDNERVYILCLFTPPLVEGQAVPFPPLIFHSMLARASIPVYLSRLNSTDVQTLLTPMKFGEKDPSGAAGAASYALPGAVLATAEDLAGGAGQLPHCSPHHYRCCQQQQKRQQQPPQQQEQQEQRGCPCFKGQECVWIWGRIG